MTLGRSGLAALCLWLVVPADAAAPANGAAAIARLREFLPEAEIVPEAAIRNSYTGDDGLSLLPDGRYFFFHWAETGPVTRDYDTGRWSLRDGLIEMQPSETNAVLRNGPVRYVPVKLTPKATSYVYLIETERGFDRLLTALAEERKARAEKGRDPASEETREGLRWVAESQAVMHGWSHDPNWMEAEGIVAEERNRAAAARPPTANRLEEFVARARRYSATIVPANVRQASDLAGTYRMSAGMGSRYLYLLLDGSYYYILHADIPETASASEELSAQAKTLKEAVAELLTIVHGRTPATALKARTHAAPPARAARHEQRNPVTV